MCGIYLTNKQIDEFEFKDNLEQIVSRGPDNLSIKLFDNIYFGHVRLSILDLDVRSNQPMVLNNLIIIFNGEIYNYKILKEELKIFGYTFNTDSDTEVILYSYLKWGNDCVRKFNGMFAFCIYDTENKIIFSARDRLGVKPLYYHINDTYFEFCSQLKPIFKNKKVNNKSLTLYYELGYIPSPFSILENVFKLEPGTYLLLNTINNQYHINKYWDLSQTEIFDYKYQTIKNNFFSLLKDSVELRLNSDVPIGTFLSGGIDSALISSISSKLLKTKLNTFTISFDNIKYSEGVIAKKFSSILNTNHHESIFSPNDLLEILPNFIDSFDEPFADSSSLPSLFLSKNTKKKVTVCLSGDGGDESFFGYNQFYWVYIFDLLRKSKLMYLFNIFKIIKLFYNNKRVEYFSNFSSMSTTDFIYSIYFGFDSLNIEPIDKSIYDSYFQYSKKTI